MSKQIQWYPGHMSKIIRELKEISNSVDVFFLLLDSRAPSSSFVSSIKEIIGNKRVIILLTKSDLVNKSEILKWQSKYKKEFTNCILVDKNVNRTRNELLKTLNGIKFKSLLPKILVLGIPNVGKSTIINILSKGNKAKAENRAGVTKKNMWYQFERRYWVLDTPGILEPKFEDLDVGVALASIGSIKIDILPIEEVAISLLKKLREKGIDIKISSDDIEEYLLEKSKTSKITTMDFYKKIILDFQKGYYGKVILDEIN